MTDEISLGDKKYISSGRLSGLHGYTGDYISRLCREGKVNGKLVGRSWFVDPLSLKRHKEDKQGSKIEKDQNMLQESDTDDFVRKNEGNSKPVENDGWEYELFYKNMPAKNEGEAVRVISVKRSAAPYHFSQPHRYNKQIKHHAVVRQDEINKSVNSKRYFPITIILILAVIFVSIAAFSLQKETTIKNTAGFYDEQNSFSFRLDELLYLFE